VYEAVKEQAPGATILVGTTHIWINGQMLCFEAYPPTQIVEDIELAKTLDYGEGTVKILQVN